MVGIHIIILYELYQEESYIVPAITNVQLSEFRAIIPLYLFYGPLRGRQIVCRQAMDKSRRKAYLGGGYEHLP